MKILLLHSDFIEVEPKKKAIKDAEDVEKIKKTLKDCLVVFISAEKEDTNIEGVAKNLKEQIDAVASQVNTKKILLYPYVHLTSKPSPPKRAFDIIKKAQILLEKKYSVDHAPFGWYKAFTISVKGHPLAELSREFGAEKIQKKVKKERKGGAFSRWIITDEKGKTYEVDKKNWKNCALFKKGKKYDMLKIFVRNELEGNPEKEGKPKHIEYMKKLELVDYCPESDVGHMKWYPSGLLIKDLILEYQEKNIAMPFGAFKIQNPLLYRLSVPEIRKLLGEFHEKDYSWEEENDNLILRFASDPGAFPFMNKLNFSYKNMPIREYEEAICFRKETRSELVGLRRVRNFLMTDVHSFCMNINQAKEEFRILNAYGKDLMDSIITKGRWVLGWEVVEEFYEKNKKWLFDMIKELGVPSFIKIMPERSHYYDMKNEFQSIEADEANTQISTVQLDTTNGERFGINYVGKDNKKHPCIIIHCSTFGSIERTICAILENAAIDEKQGRPPMLPLWLSPTQIRICPVSDQYLKAAEKLSKEIELENIRVDIDDRVESVGKKISNSEKDWIPYVIVIGEKEAKSKTLPIRIRELGKGKVKEMSIKNLIKEIKTKTKDMPFKQLSLPKQLSKRPIFVG